MIYRKRELNNTPDALQRMCRMALALKDAEESIRLASAGHLSGLLTKQSSRALRQHAQSLQALVMEIETDVYERTQEKYGRSVAHQQPLFVGRAGIVEALEYSAGLECVKP